MSAICLTKSIRYGIIRNPKKYSLMTEKTGNTMKEFEDDFLCGMKRTELSERLGVPVTKSGCDGYELVDALLGVKY